MKYAQKTTVSVAKTKGEIEDVITRYGATGYVTGWNEQGAVIGFVMNGRQIKFLLPLPPKDRFATYIDQWGRKKARGQEDALKRWEQECRSSWRALLLCIKAKLEAVSIGVTTFEHEFLAHFVTPRGTTIGDELIPKLDQATNNGPLQLLIGH